MRDVVLLFPGQGSQVPGMGQDLCAVYPAARAVFTAAGETIGEEFFDVLMAGSAEELTKTINAQPALLTHGAAVWAVVRDAIGSQVVAAAGHSLGEFTAYHAADALALPEAVQLVRTRGSLMYEAGQRRPGAMAAILGDMDIPADELCAISSTDGVVVPANYNCPGQLVISGEVGCVERAMLLAKEHGAKRAIRLNVSGAFHSPLMAEAAAGLAAALELAHFANPRFPVYSNVTSQPIRDAALARRLLVEQLTSPVQWVREMESLTTLHPEAVYVEMGPGSVLKGLMKKIAPAVNVVACGTAADVDALMAAVSA
ncbi:MAG: malonyl CoA-acyl carrier protein transacylase [Gemmatimonadetes bacterium]|nr:malonyl CoA-acyl carrier protein transacylase [Gemmatimonadota bacterium]